MADNNQGQRVPVLILGKHITALGVVRILAGRGIQTFGIESTTDIITRSRWYRRAPQTLPETSDSDELAGFLLSLSLPRAVLIACSDKWTSAVAGLPTETKSRFPASVAPRAVIEQFVDKDRFRLLVDRLQIPRPWTLPLERATDLDLATDEQLRAAFLKPTDSQRYARFSGTKGSFVESRRAASLLIDEASRAGITFMLQEWIPGNMSKTILIDGFVDRTGTIKAMVARRRIRMDPPRLANTASDVTIPLGDVGGATAALRALLAEVDYRGVFNVEFKFDDRDGKFKIIELNPRPFWLIAHIARSGVDLPWMIYLDAQELTVPTLPRYQIGRYGLYELPDAAAIVRAWKSMHRPEGPVLAPWLHGDRAIFWWTDPFPAVIDVWRALRRNLTMFLLRMRRARNKG